MFLGNRGLLTVEDVGLRVEDLRGSGWGFKAQG